ncbi:MAG TPA: lytic murein transglycosylase, partial [Gammaproteobacteria bacterium]
MPSVSAIITVFAALILNNPAIASESADDVRMRADFLAAEQALRHGRMAQFHQLTSSLQAYPLYPYLLLEDIRRHLSKAQPAEVTDFLTAYADSPLEKELRHDWLAALVRHNRWEQYLEFYRATNNTELQCHYKWAQLKTGKVKEAYEDIEQLWLTGSSQPAACDRVFNAWRQDGGMTQEHIWDRIQLALDNRKLMLVRYLMRFQTPENQQWTELWLKVYTKPSLILTHDKFSGDHPARNAILIHGVKRLAHSDPLHASNIWNNTLSHRYP